MKDVGFERTVSKNTHGEYPRRGRRPRPGMFLSILLMLTTAICACDEPNEPSGGGTTPPNCAGYIVDGKCVELTTCQDNSGCTVNGEYCYGGYCQKSDRICTLLDCDNKPGVCSAEEGKCVNAETCRPGQNDCLAGSYCDASNKCSEGGCMKADGTPCESVCQSYKDCGDGTCVDDKCSVNAVCEADVAEPNDTAQNHFGIAPDEVHTYTLCKGDVDWYRFYYNKHHFPGNAKLGVQVEIDQADVGLKAVTVEVYSAKGGKVAEKSNVAGGKQSGTVDFVLPAGEYYLKVYSNDTEARPLHYSVAISHVFDGAEAQCNKAKELEFGKTVTGKVLKEHKPLVTCRDDRGDEPKDIYHFTLKRRSLVDLSMPGTKVNESFNINIRPSCLVNWSRRADNRVACESSNYLRYGQGTSLLEPGDYYLIVTANHLDKELPYNLRVDVTETSCSLAGTTCQNSVLTTCDDQFSRFITKDCPNGCNDTGDGCKLPEGDSCKNPITIDAAANFSKEYALDSFSDQMEPARTCFQSHGMHPRFTDMVFAVEVPKGKTLDFKATPLEWNKYSHSNRFLVYMLEDCQGTKNTCLRKSIGLVNSSSVQDVGEVYWKNTGETKTVFVFLEAPAEGIYKFRVDAKVVDLKCEPGAVFCHAERELLECGPNGKAVSHVSDCALLGCSKETNKCLPPKKGDTCEKPLEVRPDGSVTLLTPLGLTDAVSTPLASCTDGSGTGFETYNEAVFKFDADENSVYTAKIEGDGKMVAWIADSCSATQETCLKARRFQDSGSISFKTKKGESGTKYLFVERGSQDEWTGGLQVSVNKNNVVPAGGSPACNNSNEIVYYDQENVERTYSCNPYGCHLGAAHCDGGHIDDASCFKSPLVYRQGYGTNGQFRLYPDNTSGHKFLDTNEHMSDACTLWLRNEKFPTESAQEYYYRFELEPGDILTVRTDASTPLMYLQEENDCGKNNKCIDSISKYAGPGGGALQYKAIGGKKVVNLVIVPNPELRYHYSIDVNWEVDQTSECISNTSYCVGSNNFIVCDGSGTVAKTITCIGGCKDNGCVVEQEGGKTCISPVVAEDGVAYTVDAKSTAGTQNPKACLRGTDADGPETYFRVLAKAGDYIEVRANNDGGGKTGEPVLYTANDCSNASNTCRAGGFGSLSFFAQTANPIVVLDYTSETIEPEVKTHVSFSVTTPTCKPGAPTCAGGKINVCSYGQPVTLICDSGSCGAIPGACSVNQGLTCQDAVDLNLKPDYFNYRMPDQPNKTSQLELDADADGACLFAPFAPSSRGAKVYESFFKVTLAAHEELFVEVEGDGRFNMFLTENCTLDTCLHSSIQITDYGHGILRYVSEMGGTYYLVIQKMGSYYNDMYIRKDIRPTSSFCSPGQSSCQSNTALTACDRYGNEYTVFCDCEDGRCKVDDTKIDACTTNAPLVKMATGGFYGIVPFSKLTNDDDGSLTCGSGDSDGADAYYQVELQPYQRLSATLYPSVASPRESIYLFKDCAAMADSCIAAGKEIKIEEVSMTTLDYQAGAAKETLFVGVDSGEYGKNARLSIKVEQPLCTPARNSCAGGTLSYCDQDLTPATFTCQGSGACDQPGKKCENPSGLICADAIPATVNAEMSGTFASAYQTVSFDLAESCTGSTTDGKDLFYSVTVPAGKTLTVKVTSDADEDLALYLANSCIDIQSSCVAGVDESNGKSETLTYTAGATDEHLILGVDSYQASNVGTFKIKFEIAQ